MALPKPIRYLSTPSPIPNHRKVSTGGVRQGAFLANDADGVIENAGSGTFEGVAQETKALDEWADTWDDVTIVVAIADVSDTGTLIDGTEADVGVTITATDAETLDTAGGINVGKIVAVDAQNSEYHIRLVADAQRSL